jgi:hypothetical protein
MPRLRSPRISTKLVGRDAPALALLATSIVIAPELLGGIYPWGILAIATANLAALGLALWADPTRALRATSLLHAMLLAVAWTIVQALPMPCAIVEVLAPDSARELGRAHALVGAAAPRLCELSRDATATREEIAKGLGIVAAFLTASMLARCGHRRPIYFAVVASGVGLAVVAAAHAGLGAERVFGVYAPREVRHSPLIAPIMNPNSLGGFFAMCVPLSVGLTLSLSDARLRILLLSGTGLMTACCLVTRSRGAVGALCLGLALFAAVAWRKRRGRALPPASRGVMQEMERYGLPLMIAAVIGLGASAWSAELTAHFRGGGWDKFRLIKDALAFTARHPWIGVGRGAFGSAFATDYQGSLRFQYAENFFAQWASEWGFPVAILLCGALAYAVLRALHRSRSLERIGALAGLIAIGVQNLVDLGFELLGVSAVAAALLGAATAAENSAPPRRAERWSARVVFAGVLGGAFLLAAMSASMERNHGAYFWKDLADLSRAGDRTAFRKTLRQAVLAHPSDPIIALQGASESVGHDDPAAGRWINRVMQLAPAWTGPHLLAARWLWNSGRHGQALLELGVAMRIDPNGSRDLIGPIATYDPEGVAALAPAGPHRQEMLVLIAQCLDPSTQAAQQIDAIILREFPNDAGALLREARRNLRDGDPEGAAQRSQLAAKLEPKLTVDASLLAAQALNATGKNDEALAVLSRAEPVAADPRGLLAAEAQVYAQRGQRNAALAVVKRLRSLSTQTAQEAARSFELEGQLEQRFGNVAAALRAYEQAYSIGAEMSALEKIAELASQLGDRRRAAWAYGMICDIGGPARDACARRDALRTTAGSESPDKAAQRNVR